MTGKNATEMLGADEAGVARAAELLRAGKLVALPTETVYGLAARADDAAAVVRIYEAKGRPSFNPLIVHVPDVASAEELADFSESARCVTKQWPGPMTLVLPRKAGAALADAVTAGLPTVAIRVPAHPVMRAVLKAAGVPLAAPSANRSGFISPTSADHVLASLGGRIDAVLDAGVCERGLESTILADRGGAWEVLRPGPIELPEKLRRATSAGGGVEAPGQLASHYAPGKPLRVDASEAQNGEFLIGFGDVIGDCSLSESGDLTEAASRLYACLHLAARASQGAIAVAPVPDEGIGTAINDRLRRAATPPD
ncbi:L-threonylcarbamoyladenylate synthase [Qipengyuania atrilutea]|uniref:Threonylcarbamoyl-AMP synthase n=1 Tax=Qipengyuania atrilutea TaxID=2744473 RepID=A0A850H1P1_9SPHN|nr:L-threonylcarbamoyladenylate synthase [Actirhodobacter atriluteus]NVD44440.1 threonylcarbamoyl-AMP synthase [Actirhodobacter atriluteus]